MVTILGCPLRRLQKHSDAKKDTLNSAASILTTNISGPKFVAESCRAEACGQSLPRVSYLIGCRDSTVQLLRFDKAEGVRLFLQPTSPPKVARYACQASKSYVIPASCLARRFSAPPLLKYRKYSDSWNRISIYFDHCRVSQERLPVNPTRFSKRAPCKIY